MSKALTHDRCQWDTCNATAMATVEDLPLCGRHLQSCLQMSITACAPKIKGNNRWVFIGALAEEMFKRSRGER